MAHCNIGVTRDLFNASLASWKNDWLLDLGETFHMNFRRDCFKNLLTMLMEQYQGLEHQAQTTWSSILSST